MSSPPLRAVLETVTSDNDQFLAAADKWCSARQTATAGAGRTRRVRKEAEV